MAAKPADQSTQLEGNVMFYKQPERSRWRSTVCSAPSASIQSFKFLVVACRLITVNEFAMACGVSGDLRR
jgi:hypothetical protein